MAANRTDSFAGALKRVWGRGGVFGCKELPRPDGAQLEPSEFTVLL
jgi:hypothetical protein